MTIFKFGDVTPTLPKEGEFWVAESAVVLGNVKLGRNASIWYGTVVRGDNDPIIIGDNTNIQDGTVLHTDYGFPVKIGNDVTVGHMVMLHGCTISDSSLIGIGARVLNGAKIGKNCIIGAHALIPEGKEIPDNSLVMGAPGKIIKSVSPQQTEVIRMSAIHYVENWKRHQKEMKSLK